MCFRSSHRMHVWLRRKIGENNKTRLWFYDIFRRKATIMMQPFAAIPFHIYNEQKPPGVNNDFSILWSSFVHIKFRKITGNIRASSKCLFLLYNLRTPIFLLLYTLRSVHYRIDDFLLQNSSNPVIARRP